MQPCSCLIISIDCMCTAAPSADLSVACGEWMSLPCIALGSICQCARALQCTRQHLSHARLIFFQISFNWQRGMAPHNRQC